MNTIDILLYISEKREEFVLKGLNAQGALTKGAHAIAEKYHICSASMTKLVKKMSLNRMEIFLIILLLLLALMMVLK